VTSNLENLMQKFINSDLLELLPTIVNDVWSNGKTITIGIHNKGVDSELELYSQDLYNLLNLINKTSIEIGEANNAS